MVKTRLIHHQLLTVNDAEATRDFYGRILGLTEIQRPNPGPTGMWFGCLSNELHISVRDNVLGRPSGLSLHPQEREGREGRHIAFSMDGTLDETAELLETEGISYVRGTAGLPQIFCEDPSGNLVELNVGWAQEPVG